MMLASGMNSMREPVKEQLNNFNSFQMLWETDREESVKKCVEFLVFRREHFDNCHQYFCNLRNKSYIE